MARFTIKQREGPPPDSPEALFRQLRPLDPNVRDLWLRQGDQLRAYSAASEKRDVAVELTTGSGKTLVGLLIGEYRRRGRGERVTYVCPTIQLAKQASEKAARYGIDVDLLTGPSRDWDPAALTRYMRAERLAVSTYSHIFNSNPRLDSPQTIVLDDAHAGEDPVASMWTIRAERQHHFALYGALLASVMDGLTPHFAERMRDLLPDPRDIGAVELVPPAVVRLRVSELSGALHTYATRDEDSSNYFNAGIIGGALKNCLVYVSWQEIAIRPLICPTSTHDTFATAGHRVYMSATFGNDGELERSFGVQRITRLQSPNVAEEQGFGRRFFIFPGANLPEASADQFVKDAISSTGRAVILAPSHAQLDSAIGACLPKDVPAIAARAFESDPTTFTDPPRAALTLANRYDGIDLPDDVCRMVILTGLPARSHLQERFILERLGARRVMSARIRTRLIQGAGRCTRNNRDYAAVVIRGEGLTSFCSREEELRAMPAEIQAEIRFGLDQAERTEEELRDLLREFLAKSAIWDEAEEYLRIEAQESQQHEPPEDEALREAAPLEIEAWEAVWRSDLARAVKLGQQVADVLGGHTALRGYRSLWLYLAGSWAADVAASRSTSYGALSNRLLADAVAASRTTSWMPIVGPQVRTGEVEQGLERRAHRGADRLLRWGIQGRRFEEEMNSMLSRLGQTEAVQFEVGLAQLGEAMGFEALPRRQGEPSPDGAWRDGSQAWIIFEAKTDATDAGVVDAKCVRQAQTHYTWIMNQIGWEEPERSVVAVVAPVRAVHQSARAVAKSVSLTHTDDIREVARAAAEVLRQARAQAKALTDDDLADLLARLWAEGGLTTENLLDRFGRLAIRDAPQL